MYRRLEAYKPFRFAGLFFHRSTCAYSTQELAKAKKNRADLAGLPRYGGMPTETAWSVRCVPLQDTPLRGMPQISLLIPLVALLDD